MDKRIDEKSIVRVESGDVFRVKGKYYVSQNGVEDLGPKWKFTLGRRITKKMIKDPRSCCFGTSIYKKKILDPEMYLRVSSDTTVIFLQDIDENYGSDIEPVRRKLYKVVKND